MSVTNYVVRNAAGRVVRSFSHPDLALAFAKAHSGPLGPLIALEQETIIRERPITTHQNQPEILNKSNGKRLRVVAK